MHQESHHHHHCHCHHGQICPDKRLFVTSLRLDYHEVGDDLRSHFADSDTPVFSWALQTTGHASHQTACQITVSHEGDLLWDSGLLETSQQELTYAGSPLPRGPQLTLTLTVKDDAGNTSEPFASFFYVAKHDWQAPWIASDAPDNCPAVFRKLFTNTKTVESARLYVCSNGLQRILLNGDPLDEGPVDEAPLDPLPNSNGSPAQFVLYPEIQDLLEEENCLAITVAHGLQNTQPPMLTATLVMDCADGSTEYIHTDDSWTCAPSPVIRNDFQAGILFDERLRNPNHDLHPDTLMAEDDDNLEANILKAPNARILSDTQAPCTHLIPMTLPPVAGADDQLPIAQWPQDNACILDFGQLISGVVRLRIPEHLPHDNHITIRYAETLEDDGRLPKLDTLPQDSYIASGHEDDERFFHPLFTCHTFRYAQISGLGTYVPTVDVAAVSLRMNLDTESTFTCSSPLINDLSRRCLERQHTKFQGYLAGHFPLNQHDFTLLPFPCTMDTTTLVHELLRQAQHGIDALKPAQRDAILIAVSQAFLASGDRSLLHQALSFCQSWRNKGTSSTIPDLCHSSHAYALATDIAQDARQQPLNPNLAECLQQLQQSSLCQCQEALGHDFKACSTDDLALALCLRTLPQQDNNAALALSQSHDLGLTPDNAYAVLTALSDNGYIDLAFDLLTSALTQDADRLASPALNHWLYSRLAGITLTAPAAEAIRIRPVFPRCLSSVNATWQTIKGPVTVHWFRHNQSLHLHVTIPFGTIATVCFNGQEQTCTTGFHAFSMTC